MNLQILLDDVVLKFGLLISNGLPLLPVTAVFPAQTVCWGESFPASKVYGLTEISPSMEPFTRIMTSLFRERSV